MLNIPNATTNLDDLNNEQLLDYFKRLTELSHYDPKGISEGHYPWDTADIVWNEIVFRMDKANSGYPACDTCHSEIDYMPWHYSKGDDRHLHACDDCWPKVDPSRN